MPLLYTPHNRLNFTGELLGTTVDAEYREARQGDVRDSLSDIRLAHNLSGYKPRIELREGLTRTIDGLLKDGA